MRQWKQAPELAKLAMKFWNHISLLHKPISKHLDAEKKLTEEKEFCLDATIKEHSRETSPTNQWTSADDNNNSTSSDYVYYFMARTSQEKWTAVAAKMSYHRSADRQGGQQKKCCYLLIFCAPAVPLWDNMLSVQS